MIQSSVALKPGESRLIPLQTNLTLTEQSTLELQIISSKYAELDQYIFISVFQNAYTMLNNQSFHELKNPTRLALINSTDPLSFEVYVDPSLPEMYENYQLDFELILQSAQSTPQENTQSETPFQTSTANTQTSTLNEQPTQLRQKTVETESQITENNPLHQSILGEATHNNIQNQNPESSATIQPLYLFFTIGISLLIIGSVILLLFRHFFKFN